MKSEKADAQSVFVGIGGVGMLLLDKLAAVGVPVGSFIGMDSDYQSIQRGQIAERVQLGALTRRGWGCSGDSAEGASCVRAVRDEVGAKLNGADVVIIVAGMGGGMGGGGAPVVAEIASEKGALVLSIAIEPFDLEGRQESADLALQRLIQVSDTVIRMSNQSIMKRMKTACSTQECLEVANGRILDAMMGLAHLMRSDGLLNINFAHVRELIGGQHGESNLDIVEIVGDVRPRAIVGELMKHQFFGPDNQIGENSGMIINLLGDDSLNMETVDKFKTCLESMAPKFQRVIGAHADKAMDSRMRLMLLAPDFFTQKIDLEQNQSIHLTDRTIETAIEKGTRVKEGVQQQLALVPVSKGRFDKGSPNLHDGVDLDVPTFLRRNMILN
ncbi:MAG: hypothetical protein P8M70_03845 [Verrucomicrobiota bacterium]|nr:hypothetical protein [Verrucomicrobiota bacterium]